MFGITGQPLSDGKQIQPLETNRDPNFQFRKELAQVAQNKVGEQQGECPLCSMYLIILPEFFRLLLKLNKEQMLHAL